jgi:hypothetical protein
MEMTQRSEEEVCCALYECDNDMDRAVIFLLETLPVGAFATTSKKKKNRGAAAAAAATNDANAGTNVDGENWDAPNGGGGGGGSNTNIITDGRDKSRGGPRGNSGMRGGGTGGSYGGGNNRINRPRESRDGDRNGTDFPKSDNWRGGGTSGGGTRGRPGERRGAGGTGGGYMGSGGRGGRGGAGGRFGQRGPGRGDAPNRGPRMQPEHHQEIDSWDPIVTPTQTQQQNDLNKSEGKWMFFF